MSLPGTSHVPSSEPAVICQELSSHQGLEFGFFMYGREKKRCSSDNEPVIQYAQKSRSNGIYIQKSSEQKTYSEDQR